MIWLGIESSCDETACAVLKDENGAVQVLSNPLYSQIPEHNLWGGVVPEIAARAHLEKIVPIAKTAVAEAGIAFKDVDAIAFTCGPGLMGPLLVGASFARGLSRDLGVPAYGVNHLEGHMAAAWLSHPELEPPFVALTVSGGHTELVLVEPGFCYTLLGRTRDDAAGEAFDKCGKILGLGYPAGAVIGKLAQGGNPKFHDFPRALKQKDSAEFSFSGLKTAVLRYVEAHDLEYLRKNLNDICASLQEAIVDILVYKTIGALKSAGVSRLVLCGGVSANAALRERLATYCAPRNIMFARPDFQYCTDNGAMIAAAAILRHRAGLLSLQSDVKPWLPLAG